MSVRLISIEGDKFEIKLDGTFKECFNNVQNKDEFVHETQFSSKTIEKFQEFQLIKLLNHKSNEIYFFFDKLSISEYIDLLLFTNQYFEEYFKIFCSKFCLYLKDLNLEHFKKISKILDSISLFIEYKMNENDSRECRLLFKEIDLIRISKELIKIDNDDQDLKIKIIKMLCGNIINNILIFMIDHKEILDNIEKYTNLSDKISPYYVFYEKVYDRYYDKFKKSNFLIHTINKKSFINELHLKIYFRASYVNNIKETDSFYDPVYLKNEILIKIFGKQRKFIGLLKKNRYDFFKKVNKKYKYSLSKLFFLLYN